MDSVSHAKGGTTPTDEKVLSEEVKSELVQEAFDRILVILQQLGVYRKSPKFFVIYAHENDKAEVKAHQEVVKDYISWFKKARLNVDSDKSPHGYGPVINPAHRGASVDIIENQICLLPKISDGRNVDYVLVFYSKLLAKYMLFERNFKDNDHNQTYSEAITEVCKACKDGEHSAPESQSGKAEFWENLREAVRSVQERYSQIMGDDFHHVLTEMAILRFRNQTVHHNYTIPIILFDNENCPELRWQAQFANTKASQLRLELRQQHQPKMEKQNEPKTKEQNQLQTGDQGQQKTEEHQPKLSGRHDFFFKILLMFETFEKNRPLIEALRGCFEEFQILLEKETLKPEEYHTQREVILLKALDDLINTKQGWMMDRPVTRDGIRDVLNLYSMIDRKSMQRVSGDILPESLDDTMLAVAVRSTSRDAERETVPLHNLFDERELEGGTKIKPKRIFIQGRPGVGKTTLCRRIMYEYSWHESLRLMFDLVVRVPRHVKISGESDSSEESAEGEGANKKNARFLIILDGLDEAQHWPRSKRALLQKLMGRPDVIITSRSYDHDILPVDLELEALGLSMESIEAYLENTQIVPNGTAADIRGFIERHPLVKGIVQLPIILDIICYSWNELQWQKASNLEKRDAPEGELESERENKRLKRSHRSPIAQGCDSISRPRSCSEVGEGDPQGRRATPQPNSQDEDEHSQEEDAQEEDLGPQGITVLYQAVIRTLWRKDIPELGKVDHGEPVTPDVVNALQDGTRLERLVRAESDVLGEIAISMMESDRLEFTDKDITAAIRRLETSGTQLPLSLERNLRKLSLLRSSRAKDSRRHRHSFVHLTFQEFFAAQHLARDGDRLKAHLQRHKYNRRYEIVWRFVAGSLSDARCVNDFFKLLDQEPRDIVGTQHIHLTMHCLSECQHRIEQSFRATIQKRLAEWNLLEIGLGKLNRIGAFPAFPESILYDQLSQLALQPEKQNISVSLLLQEFSARTPLSEKSIRRILELAADNKWIAEYISNYSYILAPLPPSIIEDVVENLKESNLLLAILCQKKLPEDVEAFFMGQIRSKTDKRKVAQYILERQEHLSDATIKELDGWLRPGHTGHWGTACSILQNQSKLPKETVDFAIDDLCTTRTGSYEILRERIDLHPEAVTKVLDYFEYAISGKGETLPPKIPFYINCSKLLPGDIKKLGTCLQLSITHIQQNRRYWAESMGRIVSALNDQNRSLPVEILRMFVQMLGVDCTERKYEIGIYYTLGRHHPPHPDVIDAIRDLCAIYPRKAVRALKGQLELVNEAFEWAIDKITRRFYDSPLEGAEAGAKDDFAIAISGLEGQQNLPAHVVEAWTEMLEIKVREGPKHSLREIGNLIQLGKLITKQESLRSKVIDAFVSLVEDFAVLFEGIGPTLSDIYGRPVFVKPLINVIVNSEREFQAIAAALVLNWETNLCQEWVDCLRDMLTVRPHSTLEASKSLAAAVLLCKQVKLHTSIISTLHEFTSSGEYDYGFGILRLKRHRQEDCEQKAAQRILDAMLFAIANMGRLWGGRHIEQFCENLEGFDCSAIRDILRTALLQRPFEDTVPAYIDGENIWYYDANGKLVSRHLEKPNKFRKRFRRAQREAGIPEWGLVAATASRDSWLQWNAGAEAETY
ncbi:NACHT domain-containing protein [Cladophialophora immunda]|nr:NACHT domain-containing protein [Cladophialophora immunda]